MCVNITFNGYVFVVGAAQTYDDSGNLTNDGTRKYKWDAFNRLREARTENDALIATYLYDAANRHARKDCESGYGGPDVEYCYDGWQIVEERDNGASNPTRQFVYGAYIDEPLALDWNTDGDASCVDPDGSLRLFYCQNPIYSVYALTGPDATIYDAYEYDPYGKHWLLSDPGWDGAWFTDDDARAPLGEPASGMRNPYTFTGREFDGESGLCYFRNRLSQATLTIQEAAGAGLGSE
ncbi:MAG: hypothetical protein NTW86_03020 [Candidatus Sumerlaeota bacterium]|nr:hypothetical protein [Candidatus Sumerlaeota bacterium]